MGRKAIALDGTTLEGGGQLFRVAICLSSLTGKAVHLTKIRGNRASGKKPGGGLKSVHLAGLAWLVRAARAEVEGATLGSMDVFLNPLADVDYESGRHTNVWKQISKTGVSLKLSEESDETQIEIGTPGSVLLILQAILPFILFRWNGPRRRPVTLRIQGGTNLWNSLSYDYAEQVLFPVLHQHLGIGLIKMQLRRRGWSTGSRAIGEVVFTIPPLPAGTPLPPFHLDDRGDVTKIEAFIVAPAQHAKGQEGSLFEEVKRQCSTAFPGIECVCGRSEVSHGKGRLYLLLVASTSTGCRLARDHLYNKSYTDLTKDVIDSLVSPVVDELKKELDGGGCVDEFMQDQLVIFQALASGRSTVKASQPGSLHVQTARWVAERVLGVEFDREGSCEGTGFSWTQNKAI